MSDAQMMVMAGAFLALCFVAGVLLSPLVRRLLGSRRKVAPPAPEQWDLTPWTDIRPPGSRNTDTAMIDRENHVLMTVEQWRAQQRRPGDTGPLQR